VQETITQNHSSTMLLFCCYIRVHLIST